MKISVLGTGRSLPARCLDSAALGLAPEITCRVAKTGVRRRYVCEAETQIDLARDAGLAALADAGLAPGDIDLIISAASVAYQPIPATAPLIMQALGVPEGTAAAFDVNSTCLSFLSGVDTAARMIALGAAKRALVVSSEIASRALPWQDQPEVASLFGDGAAAAVIGASDGTGRIAATRFRTFPSGYAACGIGAGGTRFDLDRDRDAFIANATFGMDGKVLFRLTAQHLAGFVDDLLEQAGGSRADVDMVIPHQASPAGLDHMIRLTGFDPARVVRIAADYGNQIAASIPFAFDIARAGGHLRGGSKVLLLGTSAGVSFGGMALVL